MILFSISCRTGLPAINMLLVCQCLDLHFWRLDILGMKSFVHSLPFDTLNMSSCCFPNLMISDEKSIVNLNEVWGNESLFSAFKISSWSQIQVLWVYPTWGLLSFFDVQVSFFLKQICDIIWIFLLPLSLLSFEDSHYTFDGIPQVSKALFIYLHSFFFLLLKLDTLNSPVLKFASSFFYQLKSAQVPPLNFSF